MIIESKQNPLIRQLKKCREKSGRDQYGVFLVEGTRLTFHAVKSGVHLKHLLCTPEYLEENRKLLDGLNFQLVSENVLKELCDTQHPQGIAAVVRKPDTNFENLKVGDSCFFIFCDEVRDPGNMGTIIRTAEAAGANGIVLPKGCVDIFSQKVVRSTMGSIFTMPVYLCDDKKSCLTSLQEQGCEILAAHLKGKNLYQYSFAEKSVIVIGNEANGVTGEVLSLCNNMISIPMMERVESLNAAVSLGIIAYERFRQKNIKIGEM